MNGLNKTIACLTVLATLCTPALAGGSNGTTPVSSTGQPVWAQGAGRQASQFRALLEGIFQSQDSDTGEADPPTVPQSLTSTDTSGVSTTYLPQGTVSTAAAPFFQPLGTNGRTCLTCHRPNAGWSITPTRIQALFKSHPAAPLFRPIDGAVCPTADTSTAQATQAAYSLLLSKGLIRIYIPMPTPDILQFSITAVDDPWNCNTAPSTGLTSPTTGIVSVYRRPLPATNLPFATTIMWDGREPSLASQATDAVQLHAQGSSPPDSGQVNAMVAFESALYSAQSYDKNAGDLTANGAQGGPQALASVPFSPGVNAPGATFNPSVMTMYLNWNDDSDAARASIARGQNIFNEKTFNITNVAGLNDVAGKPSIQGTCSACHNDPQVGNHSSSEMLDQGLAEAPAGLPVGSNLDVTGLPVFTVQCNAGPLAGTVRKVTDLGRAMITGQCADIGKVKTALLRNLAARPPYFHNGSAPDLATVVSFYDNRFNIGLTDQEKADLVAFLSTL